MGASLFLDFDGTLVDFVDRPDEVVADAGLRDLLTRLDLRLEGRLAVVSGRSIAQLDAMLGAASQTIALSGSHGCEHRWRGISAQPHRPHSLDIAAQQLRHFANMNSGSLVEEKSYGIALHFRASPGLEQDAIAFAQQVAGDLELEVQGGKMMIELRVPGGDKGVAVKRMMNLPPMKGTIPVFVGDDQTDEHGFQAAAELGGFGILVGEPRDSAARYLLRDPAAVRAWLGQAAA